MKNKGISTLLVLLIILGVVLIGGGVAYFYATYLLYNPRACTRAECPIVKNETADWKTYTNQEFGFEMKYPETASIVSKNLEVSITLLPIMGSGVKTKSLVINKIEGNYDCSYNFPLSGPKITGNININGEIFTKQTGYYSECNITEAEGGYAGACYFDVDENGKITTGRFATAYRAMRYSIKNNNSCLYFTYIFAPGDLAMASYTAEEPIIDQMLATLKFTK